MKNIILVFILFQYVFIHSQIKIDGYSIAGKITTNIWASQYFEGVELNVFQNNYIYSLGYNLNNDDTLFGDEPSEKYNQLNLLFGKYVGDKKFRFQYQGGIGIFWGILRTDEFDTENAGLLHNAFFTKEFSTIGFPLKIGGRYIPFKFLSIGIDLQANINNSRSIIKPMISFEIGKFRTNK
jgi:hypothetical protein